MTQRAVVIVFDWGWDYLGHEFLTLTPDEVARLPLRARNSINAAITRRIAPDKSDFHTALCVVNEDGDDLDVERASRELRERERTGNFDSRTETTIAADGAVVAYNVLKRRPK